VIRQELGEGEAAMTSSRSSGNGSKKSQLSPEAKKVAEPRAEAVAQMSPQSAEYQVAGHTSMCSPALPWSRVTQDRLDLNGGARNPRPRDHYDLRR